MNPKDFFAELKRRNVYRVAIAYAVVGWLVMQVAATVVPALHLPGAITTAVVVLVLLGFPLALVLAWAFELTPAGIKRTEDVAPEESVAPKTGRKLMVLAGVVGAIGVGLLLFQFSRRGSSDRANAQPASTDKSIAVLPFDNFNKDPENAYFADGIQDEILTRLAKIDDLKVISRTSTQRYKSSPENLPEIAKQLGVAHILEGSVQKAGDQVRVTVQLIRAASDSHIWAETYDRKLTDIFAVQTDVAENIAKSLRAKLSPAERQAVEAKPTENPEAYDAYLRGQALWNKLTTSPQDLDDTVGHFERAVQLDPQFAVAWASLSVARVYLYVELDRSPQRLEKAKEALDRALQLQPDLGEAHFAQGMYRYRALRDYEGALASFEKAMKRSADRVSAIEFSAYVKRRQGKWEEALKLHDQSLELDPRNPILLSEAALSYRGLRQFDKARALVERGLTIEPNSANLLAQLAEIHLAQGDTAEAGRLLERVPLDGRDPLLFRERIVYWFAVRQFGEATRALKHVLAAPDRLPKGFVSGYRGLLGASEKFAGNTTAAAAEFAVARQELEAQRSAGDTNPRTIVDLMLLYALLGDRAGVEREAEVLIRATANDALTGPAAAERVAAARAQLGDTDAVLAAVKHLLQVPGEDSLTPALLRLDPLYDPLRADSRFQELAEGKK